MAARAESRAADRPRTAVTTSPAATSAPRAATAASYPSAGDEEDAPAGQSDEAEGPGERARDRRSGRRASEPARAVGRGPRLAPGQRREARADETDQDGRAEQPAAVSSCAGLGSRVRLAEQVGVEAGARAGVAGRALLVDLEQHGVTVAVEPDRLHPLAMAGGLALDPVLRRGYGSSTSPGRWRGSGPAPRRPSSPASAPRRCRAAARSPEPGRRRCGAGAPTTAGSRSMPPVSHRGGRPARSVRRGGRPDPTYARET